MTSYSSSVIDSLLILKQTLNTESDYICIKLFIKYYLYIYLIFISTYVIY